MHRCSDLPIHTRDHFWSRQPIDQLHMLDFHPTYGLAVLMLMAWLCQKQTNCTELQSAPAFLLQSIPLYYPASKHLKGCSGPALLTLFPPFPFLDTLGLK